MLDGLIAAIDGLMGSPWLYLVVIALAATDAFLPVVPSETLVISAGVFASATGEPSVLLVILAAAAGAFIGDHMSYAIGRLGGDGLLARFGHHDRLQRALASASSALKARGGLVLAVARYIPGGRTAVTLTCGVTSYPLRRFTPFDAFAAVSWSVYSVLIGYFAGHWFDGDPLRGLLAGVGIALAITVIVEVIRHLRNRRVALRAVTVAS